MDQPPRIHGSAILLGTAADFFLTMVIDSIFVLARLVPECPTRSPTAGNWELVLQALGALSTVFGGWLAGRRAGEATWLHGLLAGLLGVIISAMLSALPSDCPAPPISIVQMGLFVFLAAAGGYLARPEKIG